MKKLLVAVLLTGSIATAGTVFAFDHSKEEGKTLCGMHGGMGGHHKIHAFLMGELLDLSDEQKQSVKDIIGNRKGHHKHQKHARRQAFQKLMALDPGAPDYNEKVAEIAKETAAKAEARILEAASRQAQIYAILSPNQQEKLLELKMEMRQKF